LFAATLRPARLRPVGEIGVQSLDECSHGLNAARLPITA